MPHSLGNSLDDSLNVHEPVPILGPIPALLRTAQLGDLVQLQLAHVPGPGASPASVRVHSAHGRMAFIEAVLTGTAVYHPLPGQTVTGLVGTTNYSVFLKAIRPGHDDVAVAVKYSDGTVHRVPFAFDIA